MHRAPSRQPSRQKTDILRHLLAGSALTLFAAAHAEMPPPEKDELALGFIKLTDMAQLAIALEEIVFRDATSGVYKRLAIREDVLIAHFDHSQTIHQRGPWADRAPGEGKREFLPLVDLSPARRRVTWRVLPGFIRS